MKFIKPLFLITLIAYTIFGCSNDTLEYNLENGLSKYRKVRHINESFLEGYSVKKLAFFKNDSLSYKFVFQLNDDAAYDTIAKYSFGIAVFTDKNHLPEGKNFLIWGTQPIIEKHGGYRYIVKDVETPIKYIDSLHLFLYNREGYNGVIGNMMRLKNIEL